MIIREIIKNPQREIARFDFFNDYKDTRSWLMYISQPRPDIVEELDRAYNVWLEECRKRFA